MLEIKRIAEENAGDLRLPNEPFSKPGRMIPSLNNGSWEYRTEYFDKPQVQTFPDEIYDFNRVLGEGAAFGAYESGECVGLAVFKDTFWRYWYLYDLKIRASSRGKGVGRALIEAGKREAGARGYRGIYLQAQDNNLNACLFYLKCGFFIGGFDNVCYRGTSQEGVADIYFYTE